MSESFGPELARLSEDLSDPLLDSETPVSFRGNYAALIDPEGPAGAALLMSSLPLRSDAGELLDSSLTSQGADFAPLEPVEALLIPKDPSDPVELPGGIELSLQSGADATDGALMSFDSDPRKEMVTYANTAPDTDSGVISKLTGIETVAQLRSPASPEQSSYVLSLPTGFELQASGDGGAFISDADGELEMSILAPHGVDAQGTDVPVSMSVEGSTFTLSHPHRQEGFAYPILIDPEFVVESRNWFGQGIGTGTPGWSSSQSGSSNYYISGDCPAALSSIDPCGGVSGGQGLFAGAKPNTSYPAGSMAWWSWDPPGGSDAWISEARLNSWRYRKGATTAPSPSAFYSLGPVGDTMTVTSTSGGAGNILTGTSASKKLNIGLVAGSASTIAAGANNWRYARLGAFSVDVRDSLPPSLTSLDTAGVPAGWMAGNQIMALTATASDQGLGVRGFRAFSPSTAPGTGIDIGTFACTGTYASPCGASVGPVSLFMNSNELVGGSSQLAVKAIDALDRQSSPTNVTVRVDKSAPVVTTSGSATQTNAVGPDLTVTATDGSPSARRSGIESIRVLIEREAPLGDLEVYSETLECVEAELSCPQSVTRELLLPSQAIAEGTAVKVLVEDQVGNTGIEAGGGGVPEWEIEPVAEDVVIDTTSPDAGGDGGATSSAACDSPNRPRARFVPRFRGRNKVVVGTYCRDVIKMSQPAFQDAKVIYGFGNNDLIIGGSGNQTIRGGTGNDTIFGGGQNDTIRGEAGNDEIFGGIGDDDLFGGTQNDRLIGGPGADVHEGGPGSDYLRGGQGTDKFSGGADFDTVSFADGVAPGFNNQRLPGTPEPGSVPIVPDGLPNVGTEERGVYVNLNRAVPIADNGPARLGGALDFLCVTDDAGDCDEPGFIERYVGTAFSDYFIGSSSGEIILGGAGGDAIDGKGGPDELYGGPDGDSLDGGGTAFMDGGTETVGPSNSCIGRKTAPAQTQNCARTNDMVISRSRTATVVTVGFAQPDEPSYGGALGEANIFIDGSSGKDSIQAQYWKNPDRVVVKRMGTVGVWTGGGGFTAAATGEGCVRIDFGQVNCLLDGKQVGSVVISGGPGKDNLSTKGFPQTTEIALLGGLDQDKLSGGPFNDLLVDGDSQDANGPPGTEQLSGGGGVDVLIGNRDSDRLRGGNGGDLLMSTSLCNGDIIDGGNGRDNSQWAQLPRPPDSQIDEIGNWGKENSSAVGLHIDLGNGNNNGKAGRHQVGTYRSSPVCPASQDLSDVFRIEHVEASGNPDKIVGSPMPNFFLGRSGRDLMLGGPGNDTINAAEGASKWHMDPTIDCEAGGSRASWRNGPAGSGDTEAPPTSSNCKRKSTPLRYGGSPPSPYAQVGSVGSTSLDQMAYMGEVDDSEEPVDQAGILDSSWEDEGVIASALYSMNEISGTDASEEIDPAESGTYTPDPSGAGPELGLDGPMIAASEEEVVGLDGVNDQVELTDSFDPADSSTEGYSIELWTQIDPAQPLTGTPLYSRGSASNGIELFIDAQGEIVFESNRFGISREVSSFGFAPDSDFHHVVATIEEDRLALFLDGVESAVEFDASAIPGQTPTDENLVGTDGAGAFTEMEVDSVAIYETALTLPDVLANFSLGSEEPPRFIPLEPVDMTNSDGDLLPDGQDNCPGVTNDGQVDADDNGVGDACDSSTDTDGDSIQDSLDNCPEVVNEDQEDFDSDGLGDMCTEAS